MQALTFKKDRKSNFELYRILVMLSIVAHHYVVHSGLWQVLDGNETDFNTLFLYFFGMWGKIGINCFVLITGYFMCTSEATVNKFLKLILEVFFYNVAFYFLFLLTGKLQFDFLDLFRVLLPLSSVDSGFITGFLFFYLFIPFLNRLVHNMDKIMHLKLIVLSLFIYTFWELVPTVTVTFNYVTWFIILYFISSYIRLYPNKKYSENTKFWRWMTLGVVLLSMISVYYRVSLHMESPYRWVSDSNSILAVAVALSSFMLFKNLQIKQSRLINTIATSMLGVLLIHDNCHIMREWLWKEMFPGVHFYSTSYSEVYAVFSVILVFSICVIIDQCRNQWIEKPLLNSCIYCRMVTHIENIIRGIK